MTLWLVIALIAAPMLWLILKPLFSSEEQDTPDRKELDITVYRDQLDEVDRDLARGVLDEAQADAARLEIQRRMLKADKEARDKRKTMGPIAAQFVGSFVAGTAAVGSLIFYVAYGNPTQPDLPLTARADEIRTAQEEANRAGSFEDAVRRLTERLAVNPDDVTGWELLGTSLIRMNRYPQAEQAFKRASSLAPDRPDLIAMRAEALIYSADGNVTDLARELFRRVIELAPHDPRANYYMGLAAAQAGNYNQALDIWLVMLNDAPAGATWTEMVRRRVQQVSENEGIDVSARLDALPAVRAAPGPSAEQMAAAAEMTAEERQDMILGMIEGLAARLEDSPGDIAGWQRLIRSYSVLGMNDEASRALQTALTANAGDTAAETQLRTSARSLGVE